MIKSNSKLLVTGAGGFLGRHVVSECAARGVPVVVSVRKSATAIDQENHCFDLVRDPLPDGLFENVTCVVHAAAIAHAGAEQVSAERFRAVNADATRRLARAAAKRGVERFVLVSTTAVYGRHDGAADETAECRPQSAYGKSKLEGERAAREELADTGTELIIVRPATLYGRGDPGNPERLARAIKKGRFVLPGKGRNSKSIASVAETARAIVILACHDGPLRRGEPSVFNGPNRITSLREIVDSMARACGRKPVRALPEGLASAALAILNKLPSGFRRLDDAVNALEVLRRNDAYRDDAIRQLIGGPGDDEDLSIAFKEYFA